jgi:NADH-quinone oxidoreductase subunit A
MSAGTSWLVVVTVALAGVLFFVAGMAANRLLRPSVERAEKLTSYESGVDPVGSGWAQTQIRYYLYAFLYVVFAVDAVFLFPWAVVLADLGRPGLIEMGLFVGVLALALLFAARRGLIRWTR